MGCLPSESKSSEQLTPLDYRIIWNKCLKVNGVNLPQRRRKEHPLFPQISKDIDRTFPHHPFFAQPQNKVIFERVLRQFALQFPKVGYTQGLNFIAGYLLTNQLREEQCLKTLVAMMRHPELMLIGLFEDDFPLVRLECELFWLAAQKYCPSACSILKSTNLPDELWLFQWFLTLFVYSFPLAYIRDFLNFIVVKRYFAAVRLAVAILQCLEKYIAGKTMREDSFLECFQLLKTQEFCQKFLPIDSIIKRAQKISNESIMACLQQCTQGAWYCSYFSTPAPQSHKEYNKRMAQLERERKDFHRETEGESNPRYTRLSSNTNILDIIEESMVRKYDSVEYRSTVDRKTIFFSKMSYKRCNSVDVIHQ